MQRSGRLSVRIYKISIAGIPAGIAELIECVKNRKLKKQNEELMKEIAKIKKEFRRGMEEIKNYKGRIWICFQNHRKLKQKVMQLETVSCIQRYI